MEFKQLIKIVSREKPGVKTDSRRVEPGDVFVAVEGSRTDGHNYIEQAVQNGAGYVVANRECNSQNCELVIVDDSAPVAGLLAQAAMDYPANKLINLAVTGTNGKTTVAFAVRHILRNAGKNAGLISTVQYDTGRGKTESNLTTPSPLEIAELTGRMVESGCEFMIAEASSHALAQQRLAGVFFKAAAFTNITGDHLDYHKDPDRYFAAKAKLFEELSESAIAVININSPEGKEIAKLTEAPVLWYGLGGEGDISAEIKSMLPEQTVFEMSLAGNNYLVKSGLIGKYNVENMLAAAGLCYAANIKPEKIARALNKPFDVPGRLEKVPCEYGFTVIVDYAHTDDALKNVLVNLNEVRKGRIITVFGCGGNRDTGKRPRMGRVAEQLSDIVIITSDNPRNEQPEYIIGEIVTGLDDPAADEIFIEPDRKKAIETAVSLARKDDIVLIAGKGHEKYQVIGDRKIPFSDTESAKQAIQQL